MSYVQNADMKSLKRKEEKEKKLIKYKIEKERLGVLKLIEKDHGEEKRMTLKL